jgi:autotransporter-associated beta strand protein
MKSLTTNLLLTFLAIFALSGLAKADILYSHTFDGDGSPLEAVAPDFANTGIILGADHGTSAANWNDAGVNQDGTFDEMIYNSSVHAAPAELPFTPVSGFIYTLRFTGTVSGTGPNWLGGGFINRSNAPSTDNFTASPLLYAFTRPGTSESTKQHASYDPYGFLRFAGTGRFGTSTNTTSPSTISIELNTVGGNNSWDVRWLVNGTQFFSSTDISDDTRLNMKGVGIAGFTVADIQSFSLEVTLPPITIQSLSPQGNGIYPGANLTATFSEAIALADSGTITLIDKTDGSDTRIINLPNPTQLSVSGTSLIINPATALELGTNYEVVISAGAIRRSGSTVSPFTGTTANQWTFRTAEPDSTAPLLTGRSPADGTTSLPYNSNIVATFNENIVAGSGTITLRNLTNPSRSRTIAVTDASQVTISGAVLTIDPSFPLDADTDYAVQFSTNAVLNYADVPFAGIPETDVTSWNFRTGPPSVVDILIAYTPNTLAYHGTEAGVMAHIQACIASTNNAYAQSGVTGQLRLVGTKLVNYTESGSDYTRDMDRLIHTSDGFLDEIHPLRNETGADLVCLMRKGNVSGIWGVAKIPLSTSGSANLGFSIVSTEAALAIYAFAHELGHNMGLGHGRGDDTTFGLFQDSHGHRFNGLSGTQYRTIMSYDPGVQTGRFSNPDVTYDGVATGVGPPSAANSANAARTLSIMMPVLAGYRTAGTWLGASKNWDDTSLWTNGVFPNGVDAGANFTSTDITADRIVALNGNRSVGHIVFTDTGISSHNLTLSGNTLTLDVSSGTPIIDVTQADRTLTISSAIAGNEGILKIGSGRLTLSGSNTYTTNTTINGGVLQFARTSSLHAGNAANWVKARITVNSGGTIAFNVGGTNEFTTTQIGTLLGSSGLGGSLSNNGLRSGSTIAFDTTNASGGTFTISNAIANTSGAGGGAVGLRKMGANSLVLSNTNTYSGPTTVDQGTLSVTGSLGATSVSVNGGTLSGNGNFGGNVTIAVGATHSLAVASTTAGQDTSAITGTLAMAGSTLNLTAATTPAAGVYVLATATAGITGTPTTILYNFIPGIVSVDTASTPKRLLLTITPYDIWATTNAPGSAPDADFDLDGIPNAIEFILGGTAATIDLGKLPTMATSGANMTFSFIRNRASVHPAIAVTIVVGTNLTNWPNVFTVGADTASSSAGITVANNLNGTDTITLAIPLATDTRKFARLKVGISP